MNERKRANSEIAQVMLIKQKVYDYEQYVV